MKRAFAGCVAAHLALALAVAACATPSGETRSRKIAPVAIRVHFKLDPALTRSVHMGDRWVSPSTFSTVRQPGRQGVVRARSVGVDSRGRLMYRRLDARWSPDDPELVTVSAERGAEVTITVHQPGESAVVVTAGDASTTLSIRATYEADHDLTQVRVAQHGDP